eukprot:scaffold2235_cov225-Chaetoceros_neogracile.AAC.2
MSTWKNVCSPASKDVQNLETQPMVGQRRETHTQLFGLLQESTIFTLGLADQSLEGSRRERKWTPLNLAHGEDPKAGKCDKLVKLALLSNALNAGEGTAKRLGV